MSVEAFNRLVKMVARAFYDDIPSKGENQPKKGRSDDRGIAVVVLDALTRRQWAREEDLAKDLKLHSNQLRRTLHFFEKEKLVTRYQKTAKNAKEDSYCCLDYAQIYDVVRYRLHHMNKKLKDELEPNNTVQEYICLNCGKRYTAFDAMAVINPEDGCFRCENCEGEVVAESDKVAAAQQVGDGDSNARKRRREKLKEMLKKLEEQVKPLVDQIRRVKDLPVPEFGTLQAWEARASAARRANGDSANDPSKSSQGGYCVTPMPFLGDTKVEVAFSGAQGEEGDVKSDTAATGLKVLPPWMIKQGMNLTKEQRGEVKEEDSKIDVKPAVEYSNDDKKNIQDEYAKAYYAALLALQQKRREESASALQELPNTGVSNDVSRVSPTRQVGIKSKREDDDDDDDVECEYAPVAGNERSEGYKINDLNIQVDASGGEEEEGDIWEED